ncbi:hypothetical protein [Pseudonocardia spinosispora]|uniref:hypothetical protein n=1 Tax=Pseudonocardia spinosispora TaxID=103441 RepID=UPI0012EBD95C|nr:hypothetical protein [Pseudonocardia spinosispora]
MLVCGAYALVLVGGPLYIWWDMNRYEYLNERDAVCTITKVVRTDDDQDGHLDTTQCGRLIVAKYRFGLEHDVEAGHTYRLRIGEIEPNHGPDITAVTAVEGEAPAP